MAIPIAGAYSPIEVDLWGSIFETIDQTKANQKKVAEVQVKLATLAEADEDEAIDLFAQLFDLVFRPAEGGKAKASTVIKRKWNAGELGLLQLSAFLQQVRAAQAQTVEKGVEAVLNNGRPT